MPRIHRRVTLYGTLHGPIWWPVGHDAQLSITVDLIAEAQRGRRELTLAEFRANGATAYYARPSMVEAIRAAVDDAGDFRSARLTADSFVMVEHRRAGSPDGTVRSWCRRVDVGRLPSLAGYVDREAYS